MKKLITFIIAAMLFAGCAATRNDASNPENKKAIYKQQAKRVKAQREYNKKYWN